MPRAPTTAMHTVARTAAILRRRPSLSAAIFEQPVAEAVHGLDGVVAAGLGQRAPQDVHVAAQRIARLLAVAPHALLELRAAEYATGLRDHELEQSYALRRQLHV